MVRTHHPNSPLQEAICEVRFHGSLSLLAEWGAFQRELCSEFPKLLVPGAKEGTSPLLQPMNLVSEDQSERILLSINSIAYATRQYHDFATFRARFATLYGHFRALCSCGPLTRIGVRFINALPPEFGPPPSPAQLHPCLRLNLTGLPRDDGWAAHPELILERRRGPVSLRLAMAAEETPKRPISFRGADGQAVSLSPVAHTVLDLDAYLTEKLDDVLGGIEAAHSFLDDTFFSVITEPYEAYLKGDS